jgi:Ricin-type beta-trefoil lectin domain
MHRATYIVARLIAVVLSVMFPVASLAQTPPWQPWPYSSAEISSEWDGLCLQPIDKSMESGAAIVQETCTGLPEQVWFWTFPNGVNQINDINGVGQLVNGLSGLCLDARGPAADRTPVQQWPCDRISNEIWQAGLGYGVPQNVVSLVSGTDKYCLVPPGGNTAPGVAMQINTCNEVTSPVIAMWQFRQVPPPPIEINSVLDGLCLQPINKSTERGAAIIQQTCTGLPEQRWVWTPSGASGPAIHLMNGLSGLCLDARGPAADRTPVQQWPCDQISNENWEPVVPVGIFKGTLKSRVSGTSKYCLDVPGGNHTPGLAVQIYACNNTTSQIWQFQPQTSPARSIGVPVNSDQQRFRGNVPPAD